MNLGIENKYALITGGANGIGEGITESLAKEGVNVIYTSRDQMALDRMKNQLAKYHISAHGILIDFLEDGWLRKLHLAISTYEIDILVNNAGHNFNITDPYCPIEDWRKVMELNFEIPVQICNLVIPIMKRKGWGRIVNITSVAGLENSGPVTYGVSKAALTVYTRTMGRILATEAKDVVMTAVFPGVVITKGGHWDKVLQTNPQHAESYLRERCPLGRFGKVDEISPVVVFYCSNFASFSHGAIIPVDAGQAKNYMYFNYMD
jgi:NAD(P)-dependent dehydrogenase (short-subunit alcohol dehydrogenase family)